MPVRIKVEFFQSIIGVTLYNSNTPPEAPTSMTMAQVPKYRLIGDHESGEASARLRANTLRFLWHSLLAALLLLVAFAAGRYQAPPVVSCECLTAIPSLSERRRDS